MREGREDIGTVCETFFNQMRVGHQALSSRELDFVIEGRTFELGGKSKGFDQHPLSQRGGGFASQLHSSTHAQQAGKA